MVSVIFFEVFMGAYSLFRSVRILLRGTVFSNKNSTIYQTHASFSMFPEIYCAHKIKDTAQILLQQEVSITHRLGSFNAVLFRLVPAVIFYSRRLETRPKLLSILRFQYDFLHGFRQLVGTRTVNLPNIKYTFNTLDTASVTTTIKHN